tara:strand:- start:2 stop:115 length:114 start_codon:yes stop_codon:yes gene_type:complete
MATSNTPTPEVEDKIVLTTIDTGSQGSCCGGSGCGGQ